MRIAFVEVDIFWSPRQKIEEEIRTTAERLSLLDFDATSYRAEALLRYQCSSAKCLITRTCDALGWEVPASELCRLETRSDVIPTAPLPPHLVLGLQRLAEWREIVWFGSGSVPQLDRFRERLQAHLPVSRSLWTRQLGHLAKPPRPLAFRWWLRRHRAAPSDALFIGRDSDNIVAARKAQLPVWPLSCTKPRTIWTYLQHELPKTGAKP